MKKFLVASTLVFAMVAFLGMSQLSAGEGTKCGAGKCGDSPKTMKCGTGKCGNTTKPMEGKCGTADKASKCGDAKKTTPMKCGAGKCGSEK